jgi:RNA polymerase sigma-70 factor (ECF subfamily)
MDKRSDREIIDLIVGGEKQLFQVIVDRYKNLVYSLSLRMLGNEDHEADDLAQDAFVRAFRFLDTYKDDFKFSTWISRITVNLYKDRFKKKRHVMGSEEELARHADQKNNPENETIGNIRRKSVVSIIGRLDEKYRDIVLLYFFEEFSYEEISEVLDVPMGTVKSRLNRAKLILHDEYGKALAGWR